MKIFAKEEAKERPVKARPVKAQRPVQTPYPRQQRQPERSQATVLLVANMLIQTYRKLKSFVVYL